MRVTRQNAFEWSPFQFTTDASMLELAPGVWPKTLATDLGNGLPFVRTGLDPDCGHYAQANGCIVLNVYND